ncbi:MMPL family transporter [Nocardia terpenica]|uniref:MMPL family transporter n=1 Tax=Nocardia terpenica TaxID=455432 RepID=UPI001894164E|nr:MMPL family transporter [Nocardia terpenica]MBF6065007.1 MMPL family transporter [Nocardia terpenica]MBF6108064.1 MMPL family transporter [Nocardia terpenica]MBF6115279.1 MMPL family transporter [Nocardia terpenica]MBF6122601.1 MMPL family transporter [Nocardia terpenica]
MSVYLYRWGKFAFRRKWIVLPAWLVLVVLLLGLGATLKKPVQDNFNMPNLPSQRATQILDKQFPGMSAQFKLDAVTGTYVIGAPAGQKLTDPANRAAVADLVQKLNGLGIVDHGKPVLDPIDLTTQMGCATGDRNDPAFVSRCGLAPLNVLGKGNADSVAYVQVPFALKFSDITEADRTAAYDVGDQARKDGLTVEISGTIVTKQFASSGQSEMIGIGVAFIVMMIAFGALLASFVPILTGVVGVGSALALIMMGTSVVNIPSFTSILAMMIGLALSIDYALFIVSRYKHELAVQDSPEEAAGTAIGTAGSAVVFAGMTVIIALCGLSIVRVSFLTWMGLGGALAALFAILVALTLLPALMGAFGRYLFKPKLPVVAQHDPENEHSVTNGMRFARLIGRAPAVALILSVLALGLLALPATKLSLGLPGEDSQPKTSTVRKAYDLRTSGFGEGSNGVLTVVGDLTNVAPDQREAAVVALHDRLEGYPGMDFVTMPQTNALNPQTHANDYAHSTGVRLLAVPDSGPNNKATQDLVKNARNAEADFKSRYGMEYGITGTTAIYADVSNALLSKIVPYMSIVAIAAFILLVLVFRSILVPLTAALGFLLSMAATFGATVLIFQEGKLGLIQEPHPLVSFLPIILIGLVFGLAMDYQVFLVTRMREEYMHGKSPKEAVISGYHHGARVVTSAAIIMISVFGGFLLESDVTAKSMGFALAAGVLFDAFLVRMVLIPSLLILLGKWSWWIPKWLDRILPDIDVEGTKLRELQERDRRAAEKEPVPVG